MRRRLHLQRRSHEGRIPPHLPDRAARAGLDRPPPQPAWRDGRRQPGDRREGPHHGRSTRRAASLSCCARSSATRFPTSIPAEARPESGRGGPCQPASFRSSMVLVENWRADIPRTDWSPCRAPRVMRETSFSGWCAHGCRTAAGRQGRRPACRQDVERGSSNEMPVPFFTSFFNISLELVSTTGSIGRPIGDSAKVDHVAQAAAGLGQHQRARSSGREAWRLSVGPADGLQRRPRRAARRSSPLYAGRRGRQVEAEPDIDLARLQGGGGGRPSSIAQPHIDARMLGSPEELRRQWPPAAGGQPDRGHQAFLAAMRVLRPRCGLSSAIEGFRISADVLRHTKLARRRQPQAARQSR